MESIKQSEDRKELVRIYSSLAAPLKKQLITLARVIDTTHEITLEERMHKKSTCPNNCKEL